MKLTYKRLICIIIIFCIFLYINALWHYFRNVKNPSDFEDQEYYTITSTDESPDASDSVIETESDNIASDTSAQEFVSQITIGWNLGNSLDSCVNDDMRNDGTIDSSLYETAWGNPVVTKELIDSVSNAGFNSIRIPVTWYYNTYEQDGHLYIRQEWLERVAEVVQYALDNDMYVILNSHHDAPILWADMNDIEEVSQNAQDLWQQIAEYFKDYDDNLLFEGYNELNTKKNNWQYSEEAAQANNILNQLFVDTVRSTGGNNAHRILICGTLLNEVSEEVLDSFVLPSDSVSDKLIIEVHTYDSSYNQDISELFLRLSDFSKRQSAPVIIGEFGTTESFIPPEYRTIHAGNYIARASQYGIKCFWWDDGLTYRIFDRTTYSIIEPDILNALMTPCEYETDDIANYNFKSINDYSYSIIDSESGSLVEVPQGGLTLNCNGLGLSVSAGLGYRIFLQMEDSGTGNRIISVSFYDSEHNLLSYTPVNEQMKYDITAPDDAAYMRVSLYNPWGYRSLQEYEQYLNQNKLYLEITEYQK